MKLLTVQGTAFLVLLAGLGLSFTVIGILLQSSSTIGFNILTSLGGTAFGSAIGMMFARIFEPSQMGALLQVLTEANRSSLLCTNSDRLNRFRVKMHGYLRSRDEQGNPRWRYRIFDFSLSRTPGHLHTIVSAHDRHGRIRKFIYDGYICGNNLILVGQPEIVDSEQHIVHVFPDGLILLKPYICGFCFVDTFDQSSIIAPTILSTEKLTAQMNPGEVPPDEQAALSDRWYELRKREELNFNPQVFTTRH